MKDEEFLKVISEETLSNQWGKLKKFEFDFKRRDGTWQRQIREAYDRGHGATCLLYNPETDCVLLTKQFRLPVWLSERDPFLIEAPAGLLEGAAPEDRMRMELVEETGYEISKLEHLYDAYMSPGSVTEYLAFFKGTYRQGDKVSEGGGAESEGEDIEVMHVPLSDALKMIRSGEIMDAKTIMLIQELALEKAQGEKA